MYHIHNHTLNPSEATVKEHAEYRGQAQTVVPRIAVMED